MGSSHQLTGSLSTTSLEKKKLEAECNDIAIVLVRNKIDLQPEITQSEGDQLARELGVPMLHTSVKTDTNVGEVFQSLPAPTSTGTGTRSRWNRLELSQ